MLIFKKKRYSRTGVFDVFRFILASFPIFSPLPGNSPSENGLLLFFVQTLADVFFLSELQSDCPSGAVSSGKICDFSLSYLLFSL